MSSRHIVIDWGTSNFRAWLLNSADNSVIEEISEGRGLSSLSSEEFPSYCQSHLQAWLGEPNTPIYMAGMVGAAIGWQAAPQLPLPVTLQQLAQHTVAAKGVADAWIIPGARVDGDAPDVMRGEEVQIFGAMALSERSDAVLCLPGTHSKWAKVSDNTLTHFTTSMTGEIYDIVLKHSILARTTVHPEHDNEAFEQGAKQAQADGGLLHQLFATRARTLYAGLAASSAPSYLSGLLIGSEIQAMQALYPAQQEPVLVVCSQTLAAPYQTVLQQAGYKTHWIDAKSASISGCNAIRAKHQKQSTEP